MQASEIEDQPRGVRKPRGITAEDLRWYYCESESACGVRSTHGAFVDMAQSGPPTSGSRSNNADKLFNNGRRMDINRERRIRAALQGVPARYLTVLEAAHGPGNWTRRLPTPIRVAVGSLFGESAFRGADVSLVQVAPLTEAARAGATRRVADCRPAAPPSCARPGKKLPTPQPDHKRPKTTAQSAKADLFSRDSALAASPRGAVIEVACGQDAARRTALVTASRALLQAAHLAAGLAPDPSPPRRVRVSRSRPVEVTADA